MFGWLTKKKSANREPEYSELGTQIYQLLEEHEGEWVAEYKWRDCADGVRHPKTHILIKVDTSPNAYAMWVAICPPHSYTHLLSTLLTVDDHRRLEDKAKSIRTHREQYELNDRVRQALETVKPNPFDSVCRELARAVLKGDGSAGRPLVDKAIECLSDMG